MTKPSDIKGKLLLIDEADTQEEARKCLEGGAVEMRGLLKAWPMTLFLMADERYLEVEIKAVVSVAAADATMFQLKVEAEHDLFKGKEKGSLWLAAEDAEARDMWVAEINAAMERFKQGWEPEEEAAAEKGEKDFHSHEGHDHSHAGDKPRRFSVGTKVFCNTGVWSPGVVVALDYREDDWEEGKTAPYQVELKEGGLIFAPLDEDEVIRVDDGTPPPPVKREPVVDEASKTPVTVITGFLGAGKTTLVNYILTSKEHGMRIAIIENEFGAINIDQALVEDNVKTTEDLITMQNGCICCTVRGDLINAMQQLAERRDTIDAVIIETTGLADPGPVCVTFNMPQLKPHFRVDGIVCMVDAKFIESHLHETRAEGAVNESAQQLGFADKILLNKIDLVKRKDIVRIKNTIRHVNGFAEIIETSQSKIGLDRILGISAFDPMRLTEDFSIEIEMEGKAAKKKTPTSKKHDLTGVGSMGLTHEGVLSDDKFCQWLSALLEDEQFVLNLYRCKGVLCLDADPEYKWVFQGVHDNILCKSSKVKWRKGEKLENKIVFIGRDLNQRKIEGTFYQTLGIKKNKPSGGFVYEMAVSEEMAQCNVKDITKLLKAVAGVKEVTAELSSKLFTVVCGGPVDEEELMDAADTFGFSAAVALLPQPK